MGELQYIAELLEQIRALLARPTTITQAAVAQEPTEVSIVNQPLRVQLASASVQAEIDQPIEVAINGQPIGVNIQNSPTVTIGGQPIQVSFVQPTYKYAVINTNTSGDTTIVAAVPGKKIRVVAFALVAAGTVNVKFRRNTTDITGTIHLVEAGGIAHSFQGGLFETSPGQALVINLSANVQVGGYVVYEEVG